MEYKEKYQRDTGGGIGVAERMSISNTKRLSICMKVIRDFIKKETYLFI